MRLRSIVIATALIGGCVPSRRDVFAPVGSEVDRRLGLDVSWRDDATDSRVPAAVASLLARPLERDDVVRIAVANSQRLQSRFESLGVAAGAIAEATVLPATELDLSHKYALSGSGSETEIDVVQDVLGLLQIGQRRGIAGAELAAAQARAVAATVELVARAETAFYDVVAAQQTLELRQTAFDAANASATIVERMHGAGNTTDLALARERDVREQARVDLARAQVAVEVRREALNAVLGLSGEATRWSVAGRLPELPTDPPALDDLEKLAVGESLDLAALRNEAEAASGRVGHARVQSWLPSLGVGVSAARRDGGNWEAGPAIRVGLPLFGQGQGTRARASAELRRVQRDYTATAVELRAAARATRQLALEAHAEARHLRDVVLPLRQQVLDQTLLHYNAMNATTTELLMARRELVDAGQQYVDALRRYWGAMADVAALRRGATPDVLGREPDGREAGANDEGDRHDR